MEWLLFTGPNCAACKTMKNELKKIKVDFTEHDILEDAKLASKYKVRSLPTMIKVDSNGNAIDTIIGYPGRMLLKCVK